jgi:hypothetical protein
MLNESDKDILNIQDIKETIDIINKELFNSKSLLENFFIKFNENKNIFKQNNQNQNVKNII